MTQLVLRDDRDGLTILTLNRPEKLNALTIALFQELRDHVEALTDDESVRCVVLRGAGKCFSAGNDLADIGAGAKPPSRGWHSETLRMMEKMPKPVIAAVHGHCYTGALEVALACDFILAAEDAKFADTHGRWALSPVWGMSQRLPRRVGIATAKRMTFTADTVQASEALRIGLAEYVVPLAAFEAEIEKLGRKIADNSPFSHAAAKRLLEATDARPLDAGLAWEWQESEGRGPDAAERIARFLKK
ncbi:enoyl-CoA hydratase/isomerase family protein [Albimonas sp. CAU 1670]|uniref:enoyl-CoA hydratase/isomerase family protein n=1 Tax=Albimonas sp. CAU 1670 TaxID=3032599 RepID=UPI0023DBD25F|nr:enoyl-CoA hydratase/isomerase family protein [Albimonas sp. CAU 1670]MDF2233756.1 enoyl-CoA hydratase/isomerase family protein [Albimonas sp. CAU 1670]